MEELEILTKILAMCVILVFSPCLYTRINRRPWMQSSKKNMDKEKDPERPGDVILVDHIRSPTPGLIAQMTGFMTTKRYHYTTLYLDQASRLSYIYRAH